MDSIREMQKLFLSEEMNTTFYKRGFVKFPLFNAQQIEEIRSFYFEHALTQKKEGISFNTTSNSGDIDLVKKVSHFLLSNFFEPELKKHLINFELTLSNFLVKESGENSAVPAHQDWLLVDETQNVSFNCWVCLEDADFKTGSMQFIPGSHQFQHCIRAGKMDRFFERNCDNVMDYMVDVPTKAGECVIFSHAAIHASRPNRSGHPRIAVVAGGYNKGADLYFYFNENEKIEKYKITKEDLLNMLPNSRPPKDTLMETLSSDVHYITNAELKALCKPYVPRTTVIKNKIRNLLFS